MILNFLLAIDELKVAISDNAYDKIKQLIKEIQEDDTPPMTIDV